MTVGQQLKAARTKRRLTLEEASQATRLRVGLVKALEADDFAALGGDTYVRGHLRTYAGFLGLDVDDLYEAYAEQLGLEPAEPVVVEAAPTPTPATDSSFATSSFVAGASKLYPSSSPHRRRSGGSGWTKAMVVALIGVVLVGAIALVGKLGAPTKNAPVALPSLNPTPSATATLSKPSASRTATTSPSSSGTATSTAAPTNLIAQLPGATVQLAVAGGNCWASVVGVSKGTLFAGTLSNGTTTTYNDPKGVRLILGNAGVVTLSVNGNNLGAPGSVGQVVRLAFGPDGSPA